MILFGVCGSKWLNNWQKFKLDQAFDGLVPGLNDQNALVRRAVVEVLYRKLKPMKAIKL